MSLRSQLVRPRAAALAVLLALGYSSIWTVEPGESGVVMRFGRAAAVVPAGVHVSLPWPLGRLERVSTGTVRTAAVGFRPDERARGLVPEPRMVQWLTGDTNIVELQATVNYTVDDPVAYLFRVRTSSEDERDGLVRRAVEQALTTALARTPVDAVLSEGKAELARSTSRAVQAEVDALELGVRIGSVNLVEISPPQAVLTAFEDVSSSKSDRERRITEAEGYAARVLPEARTIADRAIREAEMYRARTVAHARGESARFAALEAAVRVAPAVTLQRLWLEAVEGLLRRGSLRVVQPAPEGGTRRIWLRR